MVSRSLVFIISILFAALPCQSQPQIDYHQHLLSPAAAKLGSLPNSFTARDLIRLLDAAGVRQALVLSLAYQYGNPNHPPVQDEYAHVKEENDWTAKQVAEYPDRLRGFCGVDPLKSYAVAEIGRCAKNVNIHYGLKLHFGNSDVNMDDPRDVAQLRHVFRAADEHGMSIVVHMRPSVNRNRPYGAKEAEIFLSEVLPSAPNVPIQIAHLAGAGGFDDLSVDKALSVFITAIATHDPRMKNVYFDICGVAGIGQWKEKKALIVERIRQIGVSRILWGSDGAFGGGMTPMQALDSYRQLPLTKEEFHIIDTNLAPYMRWSHGFSRRMLAPVGAKSQCCCNH
jgi:predicted TIM-barrel fold metal-dependent hydrolase